ncbi:Transcription initiation factor TFIID subunit 5 [Rhizoctonia solani]|uniref:Transcription initiation factor TFIID subunit 5 n=1 Tax=Rhizoctonia solani TaxID=456999 RepID=A0A0K6GIF0_9AGAM|nr:Transcription initiation factor TFIID subunit 5 [Rhizoctonia solani]
MLPAVKNRTRPYEHLDNYIQRRAQMQVVSCLYGFPSLRKPTINYSYANDERISSHEKVYPQFPDIVLGRPVTKTVRLDDSNDSLKGQMQKYFTTTYAAQRYTSADLLSRIDAATLVRYGRFRMAGDGDIISTKKSVDARPMARDNSFVRYDLLPDRNTAFRNLPDVMYRQTYYGQVLDVYYVEFITQKPRPGTRTEEQIPRIAEPYLLVRVRECETGGLDATKPENRVTLNVSALTVNGTPLECQSVLTLRRCFEFIRDTGPQFNICQLESSYLNDDEVVDLDARMNKSIRVELRYASTYWPSHITTANSSAASELLTTLEQFLKKNVLLWFEIINLTKTISATPDELVAVNRWAARHGATSDILGLLQDVWRFALTMVSNLVSQSTPHIYVSMLPFLPSHSPIRKHYARRMRGLIGVDSTALDQGDPLLARWSLEQSNCATCSRDGTMVASAPSSLIGHIYLIDASCGRFFSSISHTNNHDIRCLAFSPDGTRIVSGTFEGAIWMWDVNSGQLVQGLITGHGGDIRSIIYTHDGSRIISGSEDQTIRVWDVHSGEQVLGPLEGHTKAISCLATSSDGAIISGSDDGTI